MNDSDFNALVDGAFERLELCLDEMDDDLDYEGSGGVLTVTFGNGTSMVFSRQPATRQLWLAARSGGFHFEYDSGVGDWRDTRSGDLFRPFVAAQIAQQSGAPFSWD